MGVKIMCCHIIKIEKYRSISKQPPQPHYSTTQILILILLNNTNTRHYLFPIEPHPLQNGDKT